MKKIRYKSLGIILSVALLVGILAGCGGGAIPKPVPAAGIDTIEIDGKCTVERNGDTLLVSGETNLPFGAVIFVSIHSQDGMELDSVKISKTEEDTFTQEFAITNKFNDDVKIVYAFITCAPKKYGKQLEGVLHMLGDSSEYIDNPTTLVVDEDGEPVMQNVTDKDGNVTKVQVKRSKFQWTNEGVIVTFMSNPLEF